ncbi:MAG TPA: hypothetical protein VKB75_15260 [Jatrophihabitans sp.]|nr:hypothetical protein [Jatrophihabitans sp.]
MALRQIGKDPRIVLARHKHGRAENLVRLAATQDSWIQSSARHEVLMFDWR